MKDVCIFLIINPLYFNKNTSYLSVCIFSADLFWDFFGFFLKKELFPNSDSTFNYSVRLTVNSIIIVSIIIK